jgi:hypothetical protein
VFVSACKFVSNACIYIFSTSKTLGALAEGTPAERRVLVEPLLRLDWAQTDTDYIGLGYSPSGMRGSF